LHNINENSFKTTEQLLNWAKIVLNDKFYLNLQLTEYPTNHWILYNDLDTPITYEDNRTMEYDKPWCFRSMKFKTVYELIMYLNKNNLFM